MKNNPARRPSLALAAAVALLAGCSTSTQISGDYQTPQGNIDATLGLSTNAINISGGYATTNQAVSGAIQIAK